MQVSSLELTFVSNSPSTFSVEELLPGGAERPVTTDDALDFVALTAAHRFFHSSALSAAADFRAGLSSVIPSPILSILLPVEFDGLIRGQGGATIRVITPPSPSFSLASVQATSALKIGNPIPAIVMALVHFTPRSFSSGESSATFLNPSSNLFSTSPRLLLGYAPQVLCSVFHWVCFFHPSIGACSRLSRVGPDFLLAAVIRRTASFCNHMHQYP